jgi:hypothetical protein
MKIGAPAAARRQQNGGRVPNKTRPSTHKREREYRKNQRQLKKAERATAKRDKAAEPPPPDSSLPAAPESDLPPDVL